jgi:hypothetical protein
VDWPVDKFSALPTIHPWSVESCGIGMTAYGEVYSSNGSAVYPTANKAFYAPFFIGEPTTIVKAFTVNGTALSGNVDVGIYTDNGVKLVSTGSTLQAGTSDMQLIDLTDTLLAPGSYYMAMACDNTTATFFRQSTAAMLPAVGLLSQLTAFVLPSTATMARDTGSYMPLFGLTTRTVI